MFFLVCCVCPLNGLECVCVYVSNRVQNRLVDIIGEFFFFLHIFFLFTEKKLHSKNQQTVSEISYSKPNFHTHTQTQTDIDIN